MCVSHVSYQASNEGDSRQALHKTNRKGCYTVSLDNTNLEILEGSEWLNDKIINAVQSLLKRKYPHVSGTHESVQLPVAVLNVLKRHLIFIGLQCTLFGQNLSFSVQRSEFVQILHTGAAHWICVSTIGCREGQVDVLDSLFPTLPRKAVQQIAVILHCSLPTIELRYLDVSCQRGTNDCGCYAIAFAEAICRGQDATALEFDQTTMRSHLLKCLQNEEMAPFPATTRTSMGIKTTTTLNVYCHCRQPCNSQRMIQCPQCQEWFHARCETVTSSQWKKRSPWLCSNCNK